MFFLLLMGGGHAAVNPAARVGIAPVALDVSPDGTRLYVAARNARQVLMIEPVSGKILATFAFTEPVSGVAVSRNGKTLYVTAGGPDGVVHVADAANGKVRARIKVGHTPMSPVLSADGARLYVCNRFSSTVSIVDLTTGRETAQVQVEREPVAAALSPDGKSLFVANHLPTGRADGDSIAAVVTVVDTDGRCVAASIPLVNGSTGVQGMAFSRDGRHVYLTHILARYQVPTTQLDRGWMNTNAMTILDAVSRTRINTVLLDDVDLGAANPWAVLCTPDDRWICVTHAGTHELSLIDREALHARLADVAAGKAVSSVSRSAADVPDDLSFLVPIRRRIPLRGNGPRSLTASADTVYAAHYFSDTVDAVRIAPDGVSAPRAIPLTDKPATDEIRRGEQYFNDAALCFQHWQSCASCHPSDGRVDGLNWDLLNDGIGNPKQTKSMLLSHETPPVMVSGIRGSAEVAVRAGIRFIQFAVRPESEAAAIDAYLKALEPEPSPYLRDGKLSRAARRGEKVFKAAGCATCHPKPLFTNMKPYDLGMGRGMDAGVAFDTPTLREIWRTAPYLYDGRSATIRDVLTTDNPGDRHGRTGGLSERELADLEEYILSQ